VTPVTGLIWTPDVLDGFEQASAALPRSWDGDVDVVLVRRRTQLTGGSVLVGAERPTVAAMVDGAQARALLVEDGIHDLVLSEPGPRTVTFDLVREWLARIR